MRCCFCVVRICSCCVVFRPNIAHFFSLSLSCVVCLHVASMFCFEGYCACFVVVAVTLSMSMSMLWTVCPCICLGRCLSSIVCLLSFPFSLSVLIFYLAFSPVCTCTRKCTCRRVQIVHAMYVCMYDCMYVYVCICMSANVCLYLYL